MHRLWRSMGNRVRQQHRCQYHDANDGATQVAETTAYGAVVTVDLMRI
jgi:hypothetical protein